MNIFIRNTTRVTAIVCLYPSPNRSSGTNHTLQNYAKI